MSSLVSLRLREVLLWGLLLAALFAAGWVRGASPDFQWKKIFPSASGPLIILAHDRTWLPEEVLQKIAKETKQEIQVEVVPEFADFEARVIPLDSPPLLWVPASWAQALGNQGLLGDLGYQEEDLQNKISPDFVSSEATTECFLPFLWIIQNKELRVEGFAFSHGEKGRYEALTVLRTWFKNENALMQTMATPASSALQSLDQENLPYEKRSRALRDQNFRLLKTK